MTQDSSHTPERRRPLTEEQANLIASEARQAAYAVLLVYRRSAVAGFLILLLGLGLAFQQNSQSTKADQRENTAARKAIVDSGRIVSVDGCNRDYRDRLQIRRVLIASRRDARARFQRDELGRADYLGRVGFFREQLVNLPLPDCRKARQILTDDPDAELRVPDPLYPGHTTE